MSGVCFLDHVHGESSDGVDAELVYRDFGLNHLRSPFKGFEICGGMMNDLGEKVKWGDSGEEGAASEEGDVNNENYNH